MEKYFADIAVIGGGASGMLCALSAAEKNKNKKIILIEKEEKTGRKLLATGNGRCNLTNLNAAAEHYHGSFFAGIETLLSEYPPEEVIRRFTRLGLLCTSEPDGRVYPVSRHSATVLEVLNLALKRCGVTVLYGLKVEKIAKEKRKFTIQGENTLIIAEKTVVCAGGITYPKLGSDGSIFPALKTLGHNIVPCFPALCPLNCGDKSLKLLKGVRCRGKVMLSDGDKFVREEVGEIQFTEKALSGICIFNLARAARKLKNPIVHIALLPDYSEKELLSLLKFHREIYSSLPAENIFTGIFHKNIASALIQRLKTGKKICSQISDAELHTLACLVNDWQFSVTENRNPENAQITAGGVRGGEIDSKTFESRIIKNLYFCGEVIDADGDCGGYNLQFAFASAFKVGDSL